MEGLVVKFHCRVDGIHFPADYEDTLKPPCNFWGELGMSNLQPELKRKFWDWLFSCPSDEIGIKAHIGIGISFATGVILHENEFVNKVKGYVKWTEEQQQAFQREYFKAHQDGQNMEKWIEAFNVRPKKNESN